MIHVACVAHGDGGTRREWQSLDSAQFCRILHVVGFNTVQKREFVDKSGGVDKSVSELTEYYLALFELEMV